VARENEMGIGFPMEEDAGAHRWICRGEITRHPTEREPCSPPFPNAAAHKDVSPRRLLASTPKTRSFPRFREYGHFENKSAATYSYPSDSRIPRFKWF
jgi:hypothetical protein